MERFFPATGRMIVDPAVPQRVRGLRWRRFGDTYDLVKSGDLDG
jgi:hypothetical protein